jgi:hypothetical protein
MVRKMLLSLEILSGSLSLMPLETRLQMGIK